jgi:hypothetical protein
MLQQAAFFWEQAHDTDIGCVRISNASLALAVHEECCAWTRALATAMRDLDVASLAAVREGIAAKHGVLQRQPEDLEQLKGVLHVINTIRWAVLLRCLAVRTHRCPACQVRHGIPARLLHAHDVPLSLIRASIFTVW